MTGKSRERVDITQGRKVDSLCVPEKRVRQEAYEQKPCLQVVLLWCGWDETCS